MSNMDVEFHLWFLKGVLGEVNIYNKVILLSFVTF